MKKIPSVLSVPMSSQAVVRLNFTLCGLLAGLFLFGAATHLPAQQAADGSAAAVGEVLIETKFDQVESDGSLRVDHAEQLPLIVPSGIAVSPDSASETPSIVTMGAETIGDLAPPYALIKVAPDSGDSSAVKVDWFLLPQQLDAGVFDLSFEVLAQQGNKEAWFGVDFEGQENPGASIHPTQMPALVRFGGGRRSNLILPGGPPVPNAILMPYQDDELMRFEMMVDMDRLVWSLKVNGEEITPETRMPDYFLSGLVRLHSVWFKGSDPDASFAIANIRMVRRSSETVKDSNK